MTTVSVGRTHARRQQQPKRTFPISWVQGLRDVGVSENGTLFGRFAVKKLFVILTLLAAAVAGVYCADTFARMLQGKTRRQVSGTARDVVNSGREMGRGAGRASRSMDFGRKR